MRTTNEVWECHMQRSLTDEMVLVLNLHVCFFNLLFVEWLEDDLFVCYIFEMPNALSSVRMDPFVSMMTIMMVMMAVAFLVLFASINRLWSRLRI